VITIAYTVIPVVLYAIVVAVVGGTSGAIGGDAGAFIGVVGVLLTLAFIPVLFLIYYAVPAALSAYAARDEIGAAFDPDLLKPVLFSTEYLVAVLMPIVVAVITWIATAVLARHRRRSLARPLRPVLRAGRGVPDVRIGVRERERPDRFRFGPRRRRRRRRRRRFSGLIGCPGSDGTDPAVATTFLNRSILRTRL